MDIQIRPRKKSFCFGKGQKECATCENFQEATRVRAKQSSRYDKTQLIADFCDLTENTYRIEAAP